MTSRLEQDLATMRSRLPSNTVHALLGNRDVFVFRKNTEMGIEFELALYFDQDEGGYVAQLVAPEVENAWKSAHVGHLFHDGIICLGSASMRTRPTLEDVFGRACLWAEGMAIMIRSHELGMPCEFPFSSNNAPQEINGPGGALRAARAQP